MIRLLVGLGVKTYIDKSDYIMFPTLCHNLDIDNASMKLYYYKESKLFHCYTDCGTSFDIFDLISKVYTLRGVTFSFKDILKLVTEELNLSSDSFLGGQYESLSDRFNPKPKTYLDIRDGNVLDIFTDYLPQEWQSEGITEEQRVKFNIKYSPTRNKIIIPHYDLNGQLVGIRGRALNEEEIIEVGKYMPLQIQGEWYSHPLSLNLYGLNKTLPAVNNSKKIVLFEGEKSVLLLDKFMGEQNNSAAVCGSNLTRDHIDLLLKNSTIEEITIAFDKEYEVYPSEKSKTYLQKLLSIGKRYEEYFSFSIIFDMKNLLQFKDSPVDKGKDIYQKLYTERVKLR